MKLKLAAALLLLQSANAFAKCENGLCKVSSTLTVPENYLCDVVLVNKQERFSLNLWSHVKDEMGSVRIDATLPASSVEVNKVVSSKSNAAKSFVSGSFNPTKKSVTRIDQVKRCYDPAKG